MALDLSQLSNSDLSALYNSDIKSISNEGLNFLHGYQQQLEDEQAAKRAKGELIPEGESFLTSATEAGAGAVKSAAGGLGQLVGMGESARELTKRGREQGANYPAISDLPALYRAEGLGSALSRTVPAIGYDVARVVPTTAAALGIAAMAPEAATLGGLGLAGLLETSVYGLSQVGENINRQADQMEAGTRKEFDRAAAFGTGMVQGVLEKVGMNQILGRAGAIGEQLAKKIGTKSAAEEIISASTRTGLGTAGHILKSTAGTMGTESGVEVLQEVLGRAQAGESLTDEDALEAYGNSILSGSLMAGGIHAPIATVKSIGARGRAEDKIAALGATGLDIINDVEGAPTLTPEEFKNNGPLIVEGVMRALEGGEAPMTRDEVLSQLQAKVKEIDPEEEARKVEIAARRLAQKEREAREKQVGYEGLEQAQLPLEQIEGYEGPERPESELIDTEAKKLEVEKQAEARYNEIRSQFLNGDLKAGNNKPITSAAKAHEIAIKEKNDYLTFNMQLLNEQIESRNKRQEDIFGYKPIDQKLPKGDASLVSPELRGATLPISTEGEVITPEELAIRTEAEPFRQAAQEKQQAILDEQAKVEAEKQKALIEKEKLATEKKVSKLKPGETLDIFGGKKGTIKEEVIPEPKAVEEVSPLKQVDVVDEAKRLEVPNLVTALKGLTKTAEGGPHPDTLLGKEPVGQRKATDFATAVHAEVGAKDTDVITPEHVAKANIKDLEVGKLVERAGGLPISDPKVSAAINKLTPEKQKALIDVLSKDYTPENYIKPSEMLVSKADVLNLGLRPQSGLVKELFTSPKVEAINVINDPKGAKKLIGALKKVAEVNKNTSTAVKAKELYENIDRTLAKVKVANNKAIAAKAETTETFKYSIASAPEYTGSHRPPNIENGAPLHDVTKGGEIYPADIYSPKGLQYYGTGQDRADRESLNVIKNTKNKPDALVTMYRAVPKDSSITTINNGDWVTLSKTYAKEHGESALDDDYKIISKQVKANELFTNGDSINEFGYWTAPTTKVEEPSYSTAPTSTTTGHTAASLSKHLSPELKRLVASGKAVLHDTAETLPGTGHPANVKGMTTAEGVTHYVANKLTPSTIEGVALHEIGVHAGMAKMLGDKLWSYVKEQAMTNQGEAFVKARAAVPKGTPDHLVAEEALAYLVENSPSLSLVRQIVASIRNFMRAKLGANIRLSEADARQMAVDAMRREAKTAERTAREETVFSVSNNKFKEAVPKFKEQAKSATKEQLPKFLNIFSAAGLREIGDKYLKGKDINGVQSKNSGAEILKDARKLAGMTNKLLSNYLELRKEINKYIKENKFQLPIIGDVATAATILQVSPWDTDPKSETNIDYNIATTQSKQRIKELQALQKSWSQMSKPSKIMYKKLVDFYESSYAAYLAAEEKNINSSDLSDADKDAKLKALKAKLDNTKSKGDYFPIQRFGKYAVQYTDGDVDEDTGELIEKFSKFETEAEAQEFAKNPKIKTKGVTKDFIKDRTSVLTGNRSLNAMWNNVDKTMGKITAGADVDTIAGELKDYLFQMHLMGRPEQSVAKRFLHRKGTAGYSNDIFRGFDTYALSMTKQLPRIEMSNTILSKLENLQKELPENEPRATDFYNAFNKQITDVVYPKQLNSLTNFATGAAFTYYLSAPASAALQLASIPLQAGPNITKQHGLLAAHKALKAATSLYINSINKKQWAGDIERTVAKYPAEVQKLVRGAKHADQFDISAAMKQMREEALLLPSQHAQAFSGRDKPSGRLDTKYEKALQIMETCSRPFAESESAARQVSAVASYIANIRSGMTHEAAVRNSIDNIYLDLGDYGATGQSSLVKTGAGGLVKVAMQFQQYSGKLLFSIVKSTYDSFKGETPEVKAQARKYLSQLYIMHWLGSGMLGLPLAGIAGGISDVMKDLLGDDDERHDFKEDLRQYMHEKDFNKTVINMILKGPIGTLTNMDLTNRIGAAEIIPMVQEGEIDDLLKGDLYSKIGKTASGATGSALKTMGEAASDFTKGDYLKAFEKVLPALLRNPVTAYRYATEGKVSPKGLPIIAKEEFTPWDIAMRSVGIESAHVAEKAEASRAAHMQHFEIKERRKELLDDFFKTKPAERYKVFAEMREFGRKHPGARIDMEDIVQSGKARRSLATEAIRGYDFGKNKAELLRANPELSIDKDYEDYYEED